MRWRPFHIALLIFQALWLNVIVPGHTRGVVALPGMVCSACAPASYGAHKAPAHCERGSPRSKPDAASRCAICFFAARVCPPPVYDFTLPRLGLVGLAPAPVAQVCCSIAPRVTYFGRAPPATLELDRALRA